MPLPEELDAVDQIVDGLSRYYGGRIPAHALIRGGLSIACGVAHDQCWTRDDLVAELEKLWANAEKPNA